MRSRWQARYIKCTCKDVSKIPEVELDYYLNQIFSHQLPPEKIQYISHNIDTKETKKNKAFTQKIQRRDSRNAQMNIRQQNIDETQNEPYIYDMQQQVVELTNKDDE